MEKQYTDFDLDQALELAHGQSKAVDEHPRNKIEQLYSEAIYASVQSARYIHIKQGNDYVIIDIEVWPLVLAHVEKTLKGEA